MPQGRPGLAARKKRSAGKRRDWILPVSPSRPGMRKPSLCLAAASAVLFLCPIAVEASSLPPANAAVTAQPATPQPATPKTGKERVSDKASDEQRVDNCKVPLERQGTKPRPSDCAQVDRKAPGS